MASGLSSKDINFLPVLQRKSIPSVNTRRARVVLILLAVFVVLMGVGFYFYTVQLQSIDTRRQSVEAFLYSDSMVSDAAHAQQVQENALIAEGKAEALTAGLSALDSAPRLGSADLNRIYRLTGPTMLVTELSYDGADTSLTIKLTGTKVTELAAFVERLRLSGLIEEILYTGYSSAGTMEYTLYVDEETGETMAMEITQEERAIEQAEESAKENPDAGPKTKPAYMFEVIAKIKGVEPNV